MKLRQRLNMIEVKQRLRAAQIEKEKGGFTDEEDAELMSLISEIKCIETKEQAKVIKQRIEQETRPHMLEAFLFVADTLDIDWLIERGRLKIPPIDY